MEQQSMFSVIFEVHPKPDQWDTYLGYAKMLRPELEQIDGFIDNIRYRSLTREGWILSLSGWRDEKALVRWRVRAGHHDVQQKGRDSVLLDYHLRIGQITRDTRLPDGQTLQEQRLDETEVGAGTVAMLIDGTRAQEWLKNTPPAEIATSLGLGTTAGGLVAWDVFDAVLTPGDLIALALWRDVAAAEVFERHLILGEGIRLRRVRVIRDYGMVDRREAPQYYAEVVR
jgi:heme-degrading monooxygenase HmoA